MVSKENTTASTDSDRAAEDSVIWLEIALCPLTAYGKEEAKLL